MFPGKNHMGEILMRIRSKLQDGRRNNSSMSQPTSSSADYVTEQVGDNKVATATKTMYDITGDSARTDKDEVSRDATNDISVDDGVTTAPSSPVPLNSADPAIPVKSTGVSTALPPPPLGATPQALTSTPISGAGEDSDVQQRSDIDTNDPSEESTLSTSSSSSHSSSKDFMTNGEFDIAKV